MRLCVMATAITAAIVWGACMLFVGLVNLATGGYGEAFLKVMDSLYPGYHHGEGFLAVLVGTGYGAVDGAIAGLVFSWIYNLCVPKGKAPAGN